MLKRILMLTTSFFIAQTTLANSSIVVYPENNHAYQRIDIGKTWRDAREHCETQGGYLVTLTSQGENNFVYDQVGLEQADIWLGGTDRDIEGEWVWITGEVWDYENWFSPSEPNNGESGEDYLSFHTEQPTKWNDTGLPTNNLQFPFICEWDDPSHVDDPLSVARQQGRQACIDDPASCGIVVATDCDAVVTPDTDNVPDEATSHATYDPVTGALYVPFVDVPDVFGITRVYEVTLHQQPPAFMFELDLETVKPR